jgi:hypothetical protein
LCRGPWPWSSRPSRQFAASPQLSPDGEPAAWDGDQHPGNLFIRFAVVPGIRIDDGGRRRRCRRSMTVPRLTMGYTFTMALSSPRIAERTKDCDAFRLFTYLVGRGREARERAGARGAFVAAGAIEMRGQPKTLLAPPISPGSITTVRTRPDGVGAAPRAK